MSPQPHAIRMLVVNNMYCLQAHGSIDRRALSHKKNARAMAKTFVKDRFDPCRSETHHAKRSGVILYVLQVVSARAINDDRLRSLGTSGSRLNKCLFKYRSWL
jgi:hypothetical protein